MNEILVKSYLYLSLFVEYRYKLNNKHLDIYKYESDTKQIRTRI